jgi:signal transduction histidine kinase
MKSLLNIHAFERAHPAYNRVVIGFEHPEAGQPIRNRTGRVRSDMKQWKINQRLTKNQSICYHVRKAFPGVDRQDMIRRVVTNLLENASKYSPANDIGWIPIRCWASLCLCRTTEEGSIEQEHIFDSYTLVL